jgi:glycosyltransferase involved in cell wall biosynthesis
MKVVHLVPGLDVGGAEMVLFNLLSRGIADQSEVISLSTIGSMGPRFRDELGVPVHELRAGSAAVLLLALARVRRLLRRLQPDVLQTWMYRCDLIGGLAARGGPPVIWNVRASELKTLGVGFGTIAAIRASAAASHWLPSRIVCCAEAARAVHQRLGYDAAKMLVIPNGFDVERFRPDAAARARIRAELNVDDSTPLIGLIARFDPLKGHQHFIAAAGLLPSTDARFVLAGRGVTRENEKVMQWIRAAGIEERAFLLGERGDVAAINAAVDIATCSSITEGFPNMVGEAMSCGTPCVVTDVGESAAIVGDTAVVVPPADPAALAAGWQSLLSRPRAELRELGARARSRIVEHYTLDAVARRYRSLYESVAAERGR